MGILLYVFLKSGNLHKSPDKSEFLIMTCILCAVCLVTGYTFVEQKHDFTQYLTEEKPIENTDLREFLTLSNDSTYFVFVFSYSCPHCYNSIENLKQYERLGVADKVLALSFTVDSTIIERFNDIFKPNFQINNYPPEQLFRLTNQFPVSYYIQNNIVRMEIRGLLPSGYLLQHYIQNQ